MLPHYLTSFMQRLFFICTVAIFSLTARTLFAQAPISVTTVEVKPQVATSLIRVEIYNSHLSVGGFEYLKIFTLVGELVIDMTTYVQPSLHGPQVIEHDVGSYCVGLYFVVYKCRGETITQKFVKVAL